MQEFGVFSRTSIFNSHHNSKIRKNTAQATTARRTYECTSARSHPSPSRRALSRVQTCVQQHASTCNHALLEKELSEQPTNVGWRPGGREGGGSRGRRRALHAMPRGLRGRQRGVRGLVRQKWGQLTWLKLFSLLQHLGLVGATGPHSGCKGEHRSPLAQSGEHARWQAHIVHMVRSRCGRARAPTLP